MPPKTKLILNPIADGGRAWKVANDLRPIVAEHGQADWSGTVYPGHAVELARQAALEGYGRVVAIGGDGTVHEVVNGLMQSPAGERPVLGVVPVGSGNDFAHSISLPTKPNRALLQALKGQPSSVDIGLMVDESGRREYFDNTVGIGFDAVVTIRSHRLPFVRGFLMYLTAVIQTIIFNHDPVHMRIETESETWEQDSLMLTVCNGPREGGGFLVAPEAESTDGILNYATITGCNRLTMFRLIPEVMNGTHGRFSQVRMGKFKKLSLTADRPLYLHADGEIYTSFGSNLRSLSFEILPGALQVVKG